MHFKNIFKLAFAAENTNPTIFAEIRHLSHRIKAVCLAKPIKNKLPKNILCTYVCMSMQKQQTYVHIIDYRCDLCLETSLPANNNIFM